MLSVGRFTTEEEAITIANETNYGLGAGLHSSTFLSTFIPLHPNLPPTIDDANQCMRVSSALEAGTVRTCSHIEIS